MKVVRPLPEPSVKLFWMALPWQEIRAALGGEIHLLDIGCGTGKYAQLIQTWGENPLASYHGLDVKENPRWAQISKDHSDVKFKVIQSPFSKAEIEPDINFIMTQSAIEHFESDALFFSEVRNYLDDSPKPLIQIHLLPSAACLWLYLNHGYRQYTPFTINELTRFFLRSDTTPILFPLGGRHCDLLHFSSITLSKLTKRLRHDQRKLNPERYLQRLKAMIVKDLTQSKGGPSFYAVVLLSRIESSSLGFGS